MNPGTGLIFTRTFALTEAQTKTHHKNLTVHLNVEQRQGHV